MTYGNRRTDAEACAINWSIDGRRMKENYRVGLLLETRARHPGRV
ncbi:MAG: hypothetical protein V3S56_07820 [Gemmatimonadota bacterium]